jgi:hypothetical protein
MPKLMFAEPFFCLKFSPLKATLSRVTSMDVKTCSLDPADFSTTWHLQLAYWAMSVGISSCNGRDMPTVVQLLCELPKVCGPFFWQFVQRLCGRWHIAAVTV